MPGFDGTGPLGQGPRTGGGRGFCTQGVGPAPYSFYSPYRGYAYPGAPYGGSFYRGYPCAFGFGAGRGGLPRGGGRGRAYGGGRGGWWYQW